MRKSPGFFKISIIDGSHRSVRTYDTNDGGVEKIMKKIKSNFKLFAALFTLAVLVSVSPIIANPQPNISAQAAVVMDFDTGEILFARDPHGRRAPASMTKSMTAFIIYEEIAAGRLSLDTMVPVSANAARVSSDSNMQGAPLPIPAGTYISVDTMLHLIMLPSSNGACVAMAEHISGTEAAFADRMNEVARSIGMFSEFTNSHGALNHYTNAYSMAVLLRTFIERHPDILRVTSANHVMFQGVRRNNTNLFMTTSPFPGVDGFRTGTTREAGFCLAATAYRDGRRIITIVMNAPNNDARYNDSRTLLNFGFAEAERRGLSAGPPIGVVINDTPLISDQTPQVRDGQLLLPLRASLEAMDALVGWDDMARVVNIVTRTGRHVSVSEQGLATFDGAVVQQVQMENIRDRAFVPGNFIAQVTGANFNWIPDTDMAMFHLDTEAAQAARPGVPRVILPESFAALTQTEQTVGLYGVWQAEQPAGRQETFQTEQAIEYQSVTTSVLSYLHDNVAPQIHTPMAFEDANRYRVQNDVDAFTITNQPNGGAVYRRIDMAKQADTDEPLGFNGNISNLCGTIPFIDPSYNRTMVPLRLIAEALGTQVEWIEYTRTVNLSANGQTVALQIDTPLPYNMGTPMIVNNRTFVPVAYVAQMFGTAVHWDDVSRAVYIQR